jgi:hypothetical protein
MNCIRDNLVLLKNLSFLHRQSDHIIYGKPSIVRIIYLISVACNQLSKMFATLHGGDEVEAT